MSCQRRGTTLTEVLIAVIIIGILAALALPRFGRSLEMARAHHAVEGLRQIYAAEKLYRIREGFYYPPQPTHPAQANVNEINSNLGIRLEEVDWTYSVDTDSLDDFTAIATRNGGGPTYNGRQIQINQDGNLAPGPFPWLLSLP